MKIKILFGICFSLISLGALAHDDEEVIVTVFAHPNGGIYLTSSENDRHERKIMDYCDDFSGAATGQIVVFQCVDRIMAVNWRQNTYRLWELGTTPVEEFSGSQGGKVVAFKYNGGLAGVMADGKYPWWISNEDWPDFKLINQTGISFVEFYYAENQCKLWPNGSLNCD